MQDKVLVLIKNPERRGYFGDLSLGGMVKLLWIVKRKKYM